MKLDKRIIEGKKPLTCFDTEEAKKFIGKECYFCDCPLAFGDLNKFTTLVKSNLYSVQDTEKPFLTDTIACCRYAYCLPCEWVKTIRPLTINELLELWEVGKTYKLKKSNQNMITTSSDCIDRVFYGYSQTIAGYFIQLSIDKNTYSLNSTMSLDDLSNYEYLIDDGKDKYEWKRLAVKYE